MLPINPCFDFAATNGECSEHANCTFLKPGHRTCKCKRGYSGNGMECAPINPCKVNMTFEGKLFVHDNGDCGSNAICVNTGAGKRNCSCRTGYDGEATHGCEPVNSCLRGGGGCSKMASCTPSGPGTNNCSCNDGYEGDGKVCKGINPCNTGNGNCSTHALCSMSGPGQRTCSCNMHYEGSGITCKQINYCLKKPKTHSCPQNSKCVPVLGSTSCECNAGFHGFGVASALECVHPGECSANLSKQCGQNALCTALANGTAECTCKEGFAGDGKKCKEINPCDAANACGSKATCTKTGPGSHECKCELNYDGDPYEGCAPIDSCLVNRGGCSTLASCSSTGPGSNDCKCNSGFKGDGVTCTAVNKCTTHNGGCDVNANCTYEGPGKRSCKCRYGYTGNGYDCFEVNSCDVLPGRGNCDSNATCVSSGPGTNDCTCNEGYTGDGLECAEVDPCADDTACSANAECIKTGPGTHNCTCHVGFKGDGFNCELEQLCLKNNGGCADDASCTNLPNSVKCVCNTGYAGDGQSCKSENACDKAENDCGANARCEHFENGQLGGTHKCYCKDGFEMVGDATTCSEINPCSVNNGGCDPNFALCTKVAPGVASCKFYDGFNGDGVICMEKELCADDNGGCSVHANCTKGVVAGTRNCSCLSGYTGDGIGSTGCTPENLCATDNGGCDEYATCNMTAVGKRSCKCKKFFSGDGIDCAFNDPCLSENSPCNGNQTCNSFKENGTFSCLCKEGYHQENGTRCIADAGNTPERKIIRREVQMVLKSDLSIIKKSMDDFKDALAVDVSQDLGVSKSQVIVTGVAAGLKVDLYVEDEAADAIAVAAGVQTSHTSAKRAAMRLDVAERRVVRETDKQTQLLKDLETCDFDVSADCEKLQLALIQANKSTVDAKHVRDVIKFNKATPSNSKEPSALLLGLHAVSERLGAPVSVQSIVVSSPKVVNTELRQLLWTSPCDVYNGGCSVNATCSLVQKKAGGYMETRCSCNAGFSGNGLQCEEMESVTNNDAIVMGKQVPQSCDFIFDQCQDWKGKVPEPGSIVCWNNGECVPQRNHNKWCNDIAQGKTCVMPEGAFGFQSGNVKAIVSSAANSSSCRRVSFDQPFMEVPVVVVMANRRSAGNKTPSSPPALSWTERVDKSGFYACVQSAMFQNEPDLHIGWSAALPTKSATMLANTYHLSDPVGHNVTCQNISLTEGSFATDDAVAVVASASLPSSYGGIKSWVQDVGPKSFSFCVPKLNATIRSVNVSFFAAKVTNSASGSNVAPGIFAVSPLRNREMELRILT